MKDLSGRELEMALKGPASGPVLQAREMERFDPAELAKVLEQEINRCAAHGLSHIRVSMNVLDCSALATFLRRGALLGA